MQHYEILYIIPLSIPEEQTPDVIASVRKIFEEVSTPILQEENLGKKKLGYPIKHQKYGTYVSCTFNAEPLAVVEIERKLRLNSDILRFLFVEKEIKTEEQIKREQAARLWVQKRYKASHAVKVVALEGDSVEGTKAKDLLKAHGVEDEVLAGADTEKQEKVAASEVTEKDSKVRLEELDKKLDKILEDDML